MKSIEVEESCGNVFADMNVANPEEALTKAKLASMIRQIIEDRGLSKTKAARLLGLDKPSYQDLMIGHFGEFSVGCLFGFLNDLGQEVQITIRPARKANSRSGIDVRLEAA